MRKSHCSGHSELGAALAEFALVIPLLVILLSALFDFARISLEQTFVKDALRTAGRFGAAQQEQCLEQAMEKLERDLQTGFFTGGLDIEVRESKYSLDAGGVPGLQIGISVSSSCYYCVLIGGGGAEYDPNDAQNPPSFSFSFNAAGFFPVEHKLCKPGLAI